MKYTLMCTNVLIPVEMLPVYYTPEQLGLTSNYNFPVLHLNIRSLNKHHDELTSLISDTGCCFKITGCSETWINDKTYILNLEGYVLYYKSRPERAGGGVCLYVHSSMHAKVSS